MNGVSDHYTFFITHSLFCCFEYYIKYKRHYFYNNTLQKRKCFLRFMHTPPTTSALVNTDTAAAVTPISTLPVLCGQYRPCSIHRRHFHRHHSHPPARSHHLPSFDRLPTPPAQHVPPRYLLRLPPVFVAPRHTSRSPPSLLLAPLLPRAPPLARLPSHPTPPHRWEQAENLLLRPHGTSCSFGVAHCSGSSSTLSCLAISLF